MTNTKKVKCWPKRCSMARQTCDDTIQSVSGSQYLRSDVAFILEAKLTVSPNKQYLGVFEPATPHDTGPTGYKTI